MVSHRLSTITNADMIVYVENGEVKETGTHIELLKGKKLYYNLVHASDTPNGMSFD